MAAAILVMVIPLQEPPVTSLLFWYWFYFIDMYENARRPFIIPSIVVKAYVHVKLIIT